MPGLNLIHGSCWSYLPSVHSHVLALAHWLVFNYTSWNKITAFFFIFGNESCMAVSPPDEDTYVWLNEVPPAHFPLCWVEGSVSLASQIKIWTFYRQPWSSNMYDFLDILWSFIFATISPFLLQFINWFQVWEKIVLLYKSLILHIRCLMFQEDICPLHL